MVNRWRRNSVLWCERDAKPEVIDAEAALNSVAKRRAAVPQIEGGGPAAQNTASILSKTRISNIFMIVFPLRVATPFPNIAVHVVQSPGVGFLLPHRMGHVAGVVVKPGEVLQRLRITAETVFGGTAGAAGVLPL